MINDILKEGIDMVKGFFEPSKEPTIRERILQPDPVEPEQVEVDLPEPGSYWADDKDSFDPGPSESYNMVTEMEREARSQEEMNSMEDKAIESVHSGETAIKRTPVQVRTSHLDYVKKTENGSRKGFEKDATGGRFMPISSMEGEGPDSGMSDMEIGYGIKIEKSWLTNDRSKWLKIDGVPVDIRKGISEDQASSMTKEYLDKAYKTASSKLKHWDKMAESEKAFWADLTYNGGAKAINKNPKAMAAANSGHTVEAMILALDYIKAGGKIARGLLNRRLSMYNKAALEVAGAPIIEEYRMGDSIEVKFSSSLMTDKASKEFTNKVNRSDWYKITKGNYQVGVWGVQDNYQFTS